MILSLLFSIIIAVVTAILSILPNGSGFPVEFTQGVRRLWDFIWSFDPFFPVNTLILCVTIAVSFWGFVLIWKIVHWIIRKIPALNMR